MGKKSSKHSLNYVYIHTFPSRTSLLFVIISRLWNLGDYYTEKRSEFDRLSAKLQVNLPSMGHLEPASKRARTEETFFHRICDDPDVVKVMMPLKKPYHKHVLPKSILLEHVVKSGLGKNPLYQTESVDKLFFSTVTVSGKKYANRYL